MGLDELPNQIASDVDAALQSEAVSMQSELHEAEIDLEKARLKTEERMNDRNAERDENVAGSYSGMDEMRSMFNSLMSRVDALLNYASSNTPSVIHNEIAPEENDEDEDEDEIETPVASEDIPSESPEVLTAAEKIENEVEHPVEAVENTESEIENGSPSGRGRKRRRNR
jgi:hypothetical protein